MSARPEPNRVFRESFLARWSGSRYARTLRSYGELLHAMSCESESMLLRGEPRSDEPLAVEDVRTALIDLGPVLEMLEEVPADAKREGVAWLGRSAAGWSRQLRKIAAAMEAALEKVEAAP